MHDECGVVGITSTENLPLKIYYALYSLQHRGQESAGIATYNNGMKLRRGMGLVPEVFTEEDINQLNGKQGIGHVRYTTSGDTNLESSQPLMVTHQKGRLAIAHNGHITNSMEIRRQLEEDGHVFSTGNDTEIIAHLISKHLIKTDDITNALKRSMKKLKGSYALTILIKDKIIAVRDPHGIKPLCIGKHKNGYIIASESAAIDTIGAELTRDVNPGEIITIQNKKLKSHQLTKKQNAHCFFEHVYFARPDSIMDGKSNYECRLQIGRKLGEKYPVPNADLVSPVPDSGITFAIGYAETSNLEYAESLMKNRYVGRTFIMPNQGMREDAVRLKLNAVKSNVKNKEIVLVDDSIVRGTTSKRIIKILKKAGAKKVHLRVGAPKIISTCHLGIDMADKNKLIAHNATTKEIKQKIGADSLKYIKINEMLDAMNINKNKLCLGCLNEKYPVPKQNTKTLQTKIE
ncbi:Glutamine phosphoribosylpyrophosphate amidotransferase PurF [Methanonatronarchaeum thermophilum]|uniref:Amidophosphoribosyltransferase n=1 Tax=Methanonatronarchaeum thermophilum TaxID=1927129 RepID=A0A1Y3GC14_9EURY|nr:amidophosphoribosyltransferase [Methanonatronarchaeum thermophilum]OUJ18797.1 Glutamine phosphoribosylpyrophosphate amidotransferase PurF [Methanonatronarchaeum thermophilum]